MTKTITTTPEQEKKQEIKRAMNSIAQRYGPHEGQVRGSLEKLSERISETNILPLFESTNSLLKTFSAPQAPTAVKVIDTLTDITRRVPSNGFSKQSHITITNFIDTAKSFKDDNYRARFILGIGKMVTNTDKNNPSFDANDLTKENWGALVRPTLDTACNVIRGYVQNGREREATKIVETFAQASATLYQTHVLKDVVEFHAIDQNTVIKIKPSTTTQIPALRTAELDDVPKE